VLRRNISQAAAWQRSQAQKRGKVFTWALSAAPPLKAKRILLPDRRKCPLSAKVGLGTPMPTSREYPFTGAIGQNIYVICGADNSGVLSVNEVYNTATDTWTAAAPMPTPRWAGASAVINDILYAIGGGGPSITNGEFNLVEAYDPSTDTWTTKAPMPIVNNSMYAVVQNNII
jgi:hypothetical protein